MVVGVVAGACGRRRRLLGCIGWPVVMVVVVRVRVEANRAACCGAVRSGRERAEFRERVDEFA